MRAPLLPVSLGRARRLWHAAVDAWLGWCERRRPQASPRAIREWLDYYLAAATSTDPGEQAFLRLLHRNGAPCWSNPLPPSHPDYESIDPRGPMAGEVAAILAFASSPTHVISPAVQASMRHWLACVADGSVRVEGMLQVHHDNLLLATASAFASEPPASGAHGIVSGARRSGLLDAEEATDFEAALRLLAAPATPPAACRAAGSG